MKKRNCVFPLLAGAAACAFFLLRPATADVWNKRTDVRFSQPVELPGRVVLPSGEYVMKLLDSPSQRHIVQVFNKEQNHVYATIHAIPTQRPEPADHTIITFYETPASEPMFIQKWFYPGDTVGQEFVYPKDRAHYISSLSGTKVPTTPNEDRELISRSTSEAKAMTEQEPAHEPLVAQARPPAAQPQPVNEPAPAPEAAAEPAPAAAQPAPEPAPEAVPQAQPADTHSGVSQRAEETQLPATAGSGAAFGLGGALLLAAAATVRAARSLKH